MINDKEYPATHSMATAWYCVDEEGNVGIFDIQDNGPIPEDCEQDLEVNDMFWHDFSLESKDGVRDLNLTMEQISPMLMPIEVENKWEEHSFNGESWVENKSWEDVIIKIDMAKLPVLIEAASMDEDDYDIVCLSRKEGYFYVQFAFNRRGVEMLEGNQVIITKYKAPEYDEIWDNGKKPEIQEAENNRFTIFIYHEEFMPNEGPAKRMSNPVHPMKSSQLPKEIRENITRLPLKFKDTERIQLAEHIPVNISGAKETYIGEDCYYEIPSSNGETVYYVGESDNIITKEELNRLMDQWIKDNG